MTDEPQEIPAAPETPRKGLFGSRRRKAAAGFTAMAAAAYGVYLMGGRSGRRNPVTELGNALNLEIEYVRWRGVYYAYYSRPGRGRPLVFLHSINAVASAHEMRPLVQRSHRESERPIYALEWLGFGHSDRPDVAYTPDLLEDQLEHFLEQVVGTEGGAADVIALSLGASYAAELARRRPDLIRTLVAIEPTGLGSEPSEIGRGWARLLFTLPGVQRAFYDRLTAPETLYNFARDNLFSPEFGVPDEFVELGAKTAQVEGASAPLDDFLSGRLFERDALEAYLRMRQPTLIIHGTVGGRRLESFMHVPAELEAKHGVRVVALPTGALPHWERPGEVVDHIRSFYAEAIQADAAEAT